MLQFINRISELSRLKKALSSTHPGFAVVYGRRRSGKSRLIKEVLKSEDIYYMADQSESVRQLELFAKLVSKKLPGFDQVVYPDWQALFENLNYRITKQVTICMDEFPYLVKNAPELPSVLQKIWDNKSSLKYHLILCGSSQQLMYGMVLDSAAPLYGRADEILKIKPLKPPYLQEILNCSAVETVNEYSIWGGIPRYWELRLSEKNLWDALSRHVLTSQGILYDEPVRLFLDDMRDTVHSFTLLSFIAAGCHRLSEIAARMEKPATHLSTPLAKLLDLGYIERELPFGESSRNSKKSLYKIADPFLNFYFTFVAPNRSFIEIEQTDVVVGMVRSQLPGYVSGYWERLCREAVPFIEIKGIRFGPASRWWGSPKRNVEIELDVVAESLDKRYILIGECKWSDKELNPEVLANELLKKSELLPFAKDKIIIPVLFLKKKDKSSGINIFGAQDILSLLKIANK